MSTRPCEMFYLPNEVQGDQGDLITVFICLQGKRSFIQYTIFMFQRIVFPHREIVKSNQITKTGHSSNTYIIRRNSEEYLEMNFSSSPELLNLKHVIIFQNNFL